MEEFKNYKEKQAYYKERAKQDKIIWVSTPPKIVTDRSKRIIKGSTYVKDKGDK